jgi:hypothetical protein
MVYKIRSQKRFSIKMIHINIKIIDDQYKKGLTVLYANPFCFSSCKKMKQLHEKRHHQERNHV